MELTRVGHVKDDWTRVGQAIADRIVAMKVTKAEVIARSGVSDKTLAGYIAGEPIVRADKARGLCEALGWTLDSIDRIRRGEDPVVIEPTVEDAEAAKYRAMARHIAAKNLVHALAEEAKAGDPDVLERLDAARDAATLAALAVRDAEDERRQAEGRAQRAITLDALGTGAVDPGIEERLTKIEGWAERVDHRLDRILDLLEGER